MQAKRNIRLVTKVLIIGAVIAVLSYLFHPEVAQFSVIVNGQPIAARLINLAAIPTFLVVIGLAIILTLLLFLGIGVFIFFGALFFALMLCLVIAPYLWPVLVIVFLIIALMSVSHEKPE